jgi:hypothetical protein
VTKNLGMRRVTKKFVQRVLIAGQKEIRLLAITDLLHCPKSGADFLENISLATDVEVSFFPTAEKTRQVRSKPKGCS